jgi:hypothetical protein
VKMQQRPRLPTKDSPPDRQECVLCRRVCSPGNWVGCASFLEFTAFADEVFLSFVVFRSCLPAPAWRQRRSSTTSRCRSRSSGKSARASSDPPDRHHRGSVLAAMIFRWFFSLPSLPALLVVLQIVASTQTMPPPSYLELRLARAMSMSTSGFYSLRNLLHFDRNGDLWRPSTKVWICRPSSCC